jgi:hypothetical protein
MRGWQRVSIVFTEKQIDILSHLSDAECRDIRQEIIWLLNEALRARGIEDFLKDEDADD